VTGAGIGPGIEDLLRQEAPQVLGAVGRRFGHFDAAVEAVQEALLAAATQWSAAAGGEAGLTPGRTGGRSPGVPDNPRAWLIRVASRKLIDELRSEQARRRREDTEASLAPVYAAAIPGPGEAHPGDRDDTLTLLFLCCHPSLSPPSQVALTLRAVGGLTTAESARAFLVPEPTMAQRISRAKQSIKAAGAQFTLPPEQERADRLTVVLHVLYLIFNEGYATTYGPGLHRAELSAEAIRLTRLLHRLLPRLSQHRLLPPRLPRLSQRKRLRLRLQHRPGLPRLPRPRTSNRPVKPKPPCGLIPRAWTTS
jgi:predicted RNA polymerase sigma factor